MNERIAEGEVLAGKYRIEKILGQGGMGYVVAALHMQLNQRVAIKFLIEGATDDIVARFIREARAAVRLKSEHVARVIDVGELPSGAPFMVMEYLHGSDLSGVVRRQGRLVIGDAVEYLLHACEAISEAHGLGIVHRDLKPANLFLTTAADGSPTVKVLDFGISKAGHGDPDSAPEMALTKTTAVLGSPLYMAPEQMKSAKDADARSDIWSLGAILYELIAGQVPFNASTFPELIMMANMDPPPPLSNFRNDVPPALEAAVLKCLEKKPMNRFANVAELAWAIAPFGPLGSEASAERIGRTVGGLGTSGSMTNSGMRRSRASEVPRSIPPPAEAGTISALATSSELAGKGGLGKWIAVGAGFGIALAIGATLLILRGKPGSHDVAAIPPATAPSHEGTAGTPPQPGTGPAPVVAASTPVPVAPPSGTGTSASATASAKKTAVPPGKATGTATTAAPPATPAAPPPPPPPAPAPTKKNPLDIQIQ